MADLTRILMDQKQELEEGIRNKKIIQREEYLNNLPTTKLIKVVSGIRRCGKSVLIYLMLKGKNFAYMNFDDERIAGIDTDQILSSFYEVYGKDFKYIFLDEIQNLPKWELFVNRLHRAGFDIFLTGSNSKLLSKELATHLTGRHITLEMFPFSFKEYLKSVNFQEDIRTTKGIAAVKRELKRYIEIGGFPEIVAEQENPGIYLRSLYSKIVERDIISRYNIAYKKTFTELAMSILSNPARPISYNKLKKQFAIGSDHTVKNYLCFMEEAYLIFTVNRFSWKPVEIEKSDKKVYVIDTGLINNLSIKFREDNGRIYENIVAVELLRKKSIENNLKIYYWKNNQQEEVDFVVKEGLKIGQLIQVCYDVDDLETKKRETIPLLKASKELKCKNLFIITSDYEAEETLEWFRLKGKIKFIPLWKWLSG